MLRKYSTSELHARTTKQNAERKDFKGLQVQQSYDLNLMDANYRGEKNTTSTTIKVNRSVKKSRI